MSDVKKSSLERPSTAHLLNVKHPDRTARRLKLSFKRAGCVLHITRSNKSVAASMGLIDISVKGVGIFSEVMLTKGGKVTLEASEPVPFKVSALVAWCVPIQSKVSSGRFSFRAGLMFQLESEEQKQSLERFIARVQMDDGEIPMAAPKVETPPAEVAPVVATAPAEASETPMATTETEAAPVVAAETPVAADIAPVAADAPSAEAAPAETPAATDEDPNKAAA